MQKRGGTADCGLVLYLRLRASLGPHHAAGARPGDGALLAVHLPGVLLVVEYLLVSSTRPMLHVSQGANPGANLEDHLLVVNFYIAPSWLVVDVLLAANPGVDRVPVQLSVFYLDLATSRPVTRLLQGTNPGANIPAELPLLYLWWIVGRNSEK